MSKRSDEARLEKILYYINDIEKMIKNHDGIVETLNHTEGQYAVSMCLVQIGELLGKIENPDYIQKLPVKPVKDFRNIIVHDYEGVDLSIVEKILEDDLPQLKALVLGLLN
ncbi:MAG: DUF86 domain-containing protein [Candidatus Delongbacteria bacterium]|nr:DUF86 domain-containing protein [Candidatus Delongbacteria bacterium]